MVKVLVGRVISQETLPAKGVSTGQESGILKDVETQGAHQVLQGARWVLSFLSHIVHRPTDVPPTQGKPRSDKVNKGTSAKIGGKNGNVIFIY